MMNWISFDLDWVTGDCSNWGEEHRCTRGCPRCAQYPLGRATDEELEDVPERWGLVQAMLDRVTIVGQIVVRDCHGDIYDYLRRGDRVWNIDTHTDDYDRYPYAPLACWNWVNWAEQRGCTVYNEQYPDDVPDGTYRFFVAMSYPYTNDSADDLLFAWLEGKDVDNGLLLLR